MAIEEPVEREKDLKKLRDGVVREEVAPGITRFHIAINGMKIRTEGPTEIANNILDLLPRIEASTPKKINLDDNQPHETIDEVLTRMYGSDKSAPLETQLIRSSKRKR